MATSTSGPLGEPSTDSSWLQAFSSLDPKSYLSKFVEARVRPDGRLLHGVRPTVVQKSVLVHNASGSALVKLGKTQILAATTLMVGQPSATRPTSGDLVVEFEHDLEEILNKCLDLEQLSIVPNKAAWRIRVVIMILQDDGNIFDAALLAAVAALVDTKLPQTTFKEDKVQIVKGPTKSLELKIGIALTIGVYENHLLVDPTPLEQQVIKGLISIVVYEGQVLYIQKTGSARLSSKEMSVCVQMAFGRAKEMTPLILK